MAAGKVDSPASIRLKPDDVLFFHRQLASMARLNMPLAKGLRILARDVQDPDFKRLIEMVQQDLDEGMALQDSLRKFPQAFSSLHLEIIKAGESTGNLAVILDEQAADLARLLNIAERDGKDLARMVLVMNEQAERIERLVAIAEEQAETIQKLTRTVAKIQGGAVWRW